MTRTVRMLLVVLVAMLSLGSIAEGAAPKKQLRHRTRHSSRVVAGSSTTHKKKTVRHGTHKATTTTARTTTGTAGSSGSGSKGTPAAVKRVPSTKPR